VDSPVSGISVRSMDERSKALVRLYETTW
jgi:hypothetical protein